MTRHETTATRVIQKGFEVVKTFEAAASTHIFDTTINGTQDAQKAGRQSRMRVFSLVIWIPVVPELGSTLYSRIRQDPTTNSSINYQPKLRRSRIVVLFAHGARLAETVLTVILKLRSTSTTWNSLDRERNKPVADVLQIYVPPVINQRMFG